MSKEEALGILYCLRLDWEECGAFTKLNQTDINAIGIVCSELDIANKKIEKLDNEIKSVINIIKQQPSNDDEWILGRLNGFLSIIGGE